ncbi:hemagglutinin [Influenza A virus]
MEKFILLSTVLAVSLAYDKICIGYQTNNSTETVNTLIEQNVPVTQVEELVHGGIDPILCGTELGSPLVLDDCSLEGLILGNPKCDLYLNGREWSYIVERPKEMEGVCYPGSIENQEELRSLFSSIKKYERVKMFDFTKWNVTYTGTSRACNNTSNQGSFYRSMRWLTLKSGQFPVQTDEYKNTRDSDIVFTWAIHHPPTSDEQVKLYKNPDTLSSVTTDEINRIFKPNIGPRPLVRGQQGRMDYYWAVLKPGQTVKIQTNGNLIAPEYGHLITGKSHGRILKNNLPIGQCVTECQLNEGVMNTSKPFQNTSKHYIGRCPKYIPAGSLKLAIGLRNVPQVQDRGLFGAIAGFIEGGWPGLVAGWYGFQHQNAEGTGIAADRDSTQKAIDNMQNKLNNVIDKMNKQFEVVNHEFSEVESRMNMINSKIDDQITDIWAYNAELLVLLENQKTLDEHDANVRNLHDRIRRVLRENAIDTGDGCFEILHKCDNNCMDTIRNGTYDHKEYEEESKIERQKINGVKLEENSTYKILSIYSSVASSLVLLLMIIGGFIFGCQNGNVRCTFCI